MMMIIETLSKLGFKPDDAKIADEAKIMEKTGLDQATIESAQKLSATVKETPTPSSSLQLTAEKQHVLNTLAIHQLNTLKTPASSSSSTINLANKLLPKLDDAVKLEVPTIATISPSNAAMQPTLSHATNPALALQQNKAYEKIMSLRNYTPYFKAKYHLGDDFKDALDTTADGSSSDESSSGQWTVNPLSFNARSRQNKQLQKKQQQKPANDELLSASGYNYNNNNNNYDNVMPTKQQSMGYANKNNGYQQQQSYQAPPPPQQQYQAAPYQPPVPPAPPAPSAPTYGTSKKLISLLIT